MDGFVVTFVLILICAAVPLLSKLREWLSSDLNDDVGSAADREREKLNGHWVARSNHPDEPVVKLFFVGRRFTVKWADQSFDQGTYRVDPQKEPRTVDLEVANGAHAGKTFQGIYRWQRGELQWCCAGPECERPAQFTANPECNITLCEFIRDRD
jgi:uncharacterized protein (TIGR03067 family)